MTKLFIPQETHLVNVSYPQFASSFFAACVLWFDTKSVDSNLLVDFTRAENRAREIALLIKQNKKKHGYCQQNRFLTHGAELFLMQPYLIQCSYM